MPGDGVSTQFKAAWVKMPTISSHFLVCSARYAGNARMVDTWVLMFQHLGASDIAGYRGAAGGADSWLLARIVTSSMSLVAYTSLIFRTWLLWTVNDQVQSAPEPAVPCTCTGRGRSRISSSWMWTRGNEAYCH